MFPEGCIKAEIKEAIEPKIRRAVYRGKILMSQFPGLHLISFWIIHYNTVITVLQPVLQ